MFKLLILIIINYSHSDFISIRIEGWKVKLWEGQSNFNMRDIDLEDYSNEYYLLNEKPTLYEVKELLYKPVQIKNSLKNNSPDYAIELIEFYYLERTIKNGIYPKIALGYKLDDKETIVFQAYQQSFINKRIFAIEITNQYNGYLYLGGIPDHIKNFNNFSCKINSKYATWGCALSSILFFNFNFEVNEYIYFNLHQVNIAFHYEFVNYFNDAMKTYKKYNVERFNNDNIKFSLMFRFEDNIVEVPNQIVINSNGEYYLNNYNISKTFYSFGQDFFREYVIKFDYEMKEITIYGTKGLKYSNMVKRKKLLGVNLIILIIGLINIFIKLLFAE